MQPVHVTEDRLADVLGQISDRLDRIEKNQKEMDEQLGKRLDKQDEKLDDIKQILERVDNRAKFIGQAVEDLQSNRDIGVA